MMRTRRRRPAYTPVWDGKAWHLYDHDGNRITSMKPISDDLLDILHAFILADKAARKYANAYMNRLIKNKWAA